MTRINLALCLLLICGCDKQVFIQRASSMSPTIKADERVYADMSAYTYRSPQRWDVVLLQTPSPYENQGMLVFRVVGLPGETVSFDENGLLINGKKPEMPAALSKIHYTPAPKDQPPSPLLPYKVPANSYFVLGDDPSIANDSRMWGAIPRDQILGKVLNK